MGGQPGPLWVCGKLDPAIGPTIGCFEAYGVSLAGSNVVNYTIPSTYPNLRTGLFNATLLAGSVSPAMAPTEVLRNSFSWVFELRQPDDYAVLNASKCLPSLYEQVRRVGRCCPKQVLVLIAQCAVTTARHGERSAHCRLQSPR